MNTNPTENLIEDLKKFKFRNQREFSSQIFGTDFFNGKKKHKNILGSTQSMRTFDHAQRISTTQKRELLSSFKSA